MDHAGEENQPSTIASVPASVPEAPRSAVRGIFVGRDGLRAGWRFLIFFLILQTLVSGLGFTLRLLHVAKPSTANLRTLTTIRVIAFDGVSFLFVCLATWIMAKFERRRFGVYGLPWKAGIGRDCGEGALWGFLAISGTLFTIFALHGYRIAGIAIHGRTLVTSFALWTIAFLLVGLSEEFSFRGYAQYTLSGGMGFWPAAFLLSCSFAAVHLGNSGETKLGILSVVWFGLLFCLILRRKGNLWWAVGFHAGWDWGQTFFYGVPDSGLLASNNFFNSEFHGASWLTGGSVGPEASIFTPIALAIVALLFSLRYREARYQPALPRESRPAMPATAL